MLSPLRPARTKATPIITAVKQQNRQRVTLLSSPYIEERNLEAATSGIRAADQEPRRDARNSAFLDYYRCPERFAHFTLTGEPSASSGYFQFGPDAICYGQCCQGSLAKHATDDLYDAENDVGGDNHTLRFPFNPSEVIANLRRERYRSSLNGEGAVSPILRNAYYLVRPLLPVSVRKHLQRIQLRGWEEIPFPSWPVDLTVERILEKLLALLLKPGSTNKIPFIWFWPNGSPSCAIMTHDVETAAGQDFCSELMDLDDACGVKSSFQVIPENRYPVTYSFLEQIRRRGFEINIHDLNHDGHLFRTRELFLRRADRINRYGREYGASGFRSGALYHNLDWYEALNFSYDMSVPSVGHLEAQRGGCCSVMPFFVGNIVELPVTTTQDYSLFHVLNQYSTDLWKRQVTQITKSHGLASFIVHPDYVMEPRARATYKSLLAYLAGLRSEGRVWIARPGEVNQWWRARSQMKLVYQANKWVIEGPEKDKALVAYAILEQDCLRYELQPADHEVPQSDKRPALVLPGPERGKPAA
ncbi:MAG: hypothetical protein DMG69_32560 [Acidobacteria bacterium]|nr:MAG: hypothetical protein DMG69_32560 [Acidobacteriota bacterium]